MKKLVIVGTGARGTASFAAALLRDFAGRVQIAGIFDVNRLRAEACNKLLDAELPIFDDFDAMMDATRPAGVIVTTPDATHAEYVVKALQRGCDAFCEKPLCTTAGHVHDIRTAAAASSAKGYVTHNMRFLPDTEVLKRRLMDGEIGELLHVTFAETLDRYHGADYFRRWHRSMANSGGLLIHKASHHFDVLNWLADSLPTTVTAQGGLRFYGHNGPFRGPRCSACPHAGQCDFHADVFADQRMQTLYKEPESADGYFRDGCVFDPAIDICDTASATIAYENGVTMGYTLTAYASHESIYLAAEGTRGRLELYHRIDTSWAVGAKAAAEGTLDNDPEAIESRHRLTLYLPHQQRAIDLTAESVAGGHGGSDPKLREFLFGDGAADDPLNQKAPLEEGIQAVLVGIAANRSIRENGTPVAVQSL